MEFYSLGDSRYYGYTEYLVSLPLLQLNSSSVPWLGQEGLIDIFLELLNVSQPVDTLWLEIIVKKIRKEREDRTEERRKGRK